MKPEPLRGAELVADLRAILDPLRGIPTATPDRAALEHTRASAGRKGRAMTHRKGMAAMAAGKLAPKKGQPGRTRGRRNPNGVAAMAASNRKIDVAEAKRRHDAGQTTAAIAATYGCTPAAVCRALRAAGRHPRRSPMTKDQFRRRFAKLGAAALAEAEGYHLKNVVARARRLGLLP